LEEIVAAPVKKTETNDRGGSVVLTTQHPPSAKVGTTSPTSGGRSVGIVRSRTKATEFTTGTKGRHRQLVTQAITSLEIY
jgi:hypothetical protein